MTTTAEPGLFPVTEVSAPQSPTPRQAAVLVRKALRAAAVQARRAEKLAAKQAAKDAKFAEAAGERIPLPAVKVRGEIPRSVDLVRARTLVAEAVLRSGALTVDVEHSGYPVGHEAFELRLVQLGDGDAAVVFDPSDPEQYRLIRDLLAVPSYLIAFSATADLVPLAYVGLVDYASAWDRMYDPSIPALLNDPGGNDSDSDKGLKQLAPRILGDQAETPGAEAARKTLFKQAKWLSEPKLDTPVERNGWAQVPRDCATMVTYAASDVLDTAPLGRRLPQVPPAVLARERAVQAMTARVSLHGLRIDAEQVRNLTALHTVGRALAARKIQALGVADAGSDRQVATRLAELGVDLPRTAPSTRFPQGQLSVANGAIDPFKDLPGEAGELVRARLDYQHHDTALTLFCVPYGALCTHGDGRVRPTIYTLGADSGRMSCVRQNLQQLSREGGIRSMITADPGHLLIGADFSGVELRVAAALSGCRKLLSVIEAADAAPKGSKVDIHWQIALQVYGSDATYSNRYNMKRVVFGWLYGGGIPTLARQTNIREVDAAAAVETLAWIAPGVVEWSNKIKRAVRNGQLEYQTYSGRVIHFPRAYPHKAPNFAVQGTARELTVDACLRWRDTQWGKAIMWPVHDELDAMVPEGEAVDATAALKDCMSLELYGVKIKAEASEPSPYWADAA